MTNLEGDTIINADFKDGFNDKHLNKQPGYHNPEAEEKLKNIIKTFIKFLKEEVD